MIKLIASDLDGTLLYGRDNTVSEEMFEMIREMQRRGVIFAAASGRQYSNVKRLFEPVWQEMAFICENGASVFYKDRLLAERVVPMETMLELVSIIEKEPCSEVALSSSTTTYVKPKDPAYARMLREFGNHVCEVKDWAEVKEPCVKLAFYEKDGVDHRVDYWRERILPPAKVVTSGNQWLDVLYPDSHKGVGMGVLQKHFGLERKEMAAFGDNDNDLEMLEAVGTPVAMDNAKEGVKKLCPYHTDRVEHAVRSILDGSFPEDGFRKSVE